MTARSDFNGVISEWLDEQAGRGAPDYLDDVLSRTTRTRQRPAWSSLERWLPVQTTLRLAPVPRLAWLLVVVALIAALGVAVLAVGTRHRQLPPPFGLARNGAVLYGGSDGDIHKLDPATGATSTLVAGASGDSVPWLSPDGTRFLFLRDSVPNADTGGKAATIMVADDDGSNVRALTGQLENIQEATWSHDGSRVAVSADIAGQAALQIFSVDGNSAPLVVDTGGLTTLYLAFVPGDRELTFHGTKGNVAGLFAVGTDGRGLRTIVPNGVTDFGVLSPDGTKLAYQVYEGTVGAVRVVEAATGRDVTPAFDPPTGGGVVDDRPAWSPDGSRLLFARYHGTAAYRLAVMEAIGGRVAEIGPTRTVTVADYAQFSPDGTSVMAYFDSDKSTWLLDPTGATPDRQLPSSIAARAAWQRLAVAP